MNVYCTQCGRTIVTDSPMGAHDCVRTYAQACEESAEQSGCGPIVDALKLAGFSPVVEQTGGFTMVPTVYCADGSYVCVTWEGADDYCVGAYGPWDDVNDTQTDYGYVTIPLHDIGNAVHDVVREHHGEEGSQRGTVQG